MSNTRYVSVTFQSGIKQNVPSQLLPVPLLTKANNLVVNKEGQLISRPNFEKLEGVELPSGAGKPLKLFTYNTQLYCITETNILTFNRVESRWYDFVGNVYDILEAGRRHNLSLNTTHVTQKETDIQNLAFANWSDDRLYFFYTYASIEQNPGRFYYKAFSIKDNRVIGVEHSFNHGGVITGMYALNAGVDGFWLGISRPNEIVFEKVASLWSNGGINIDDSKRVHFRADNVQRFTMFRDTVYYTTDGITTQKAVYNPDARLKEADVGGNVILNVSGTHARDFSGETMYDFYNWADFQVQLQEAGRPPEFYRMVWSVQTGYFLINKDNRLVGHLYGNFTPFSPGNPFRVNYTGSAYVAGSKVYMPILRSGQVEVVNREAITDRIIDEGSGRRGAELVAFRPLGLELLTMDFDTDAIPQTAQIGRELVISGPLLSWTDRQTLSEYQFTEKPDIKKTTRLDFDKWAYSDLDVTLPSVQDLNRDQYNEIRATLGAFSSPYLISSVTFKAGVGGGFSGRRITGNLGSWSATATTSARTTRFGTAVDGSPMLTGPVLSQVYHSNTDQAIIAVFSNTQLLTGRDFPQAVVVNGVRYVFSYFNRQATVLIAYCYGVAVSPFSAGTDYEVGIPKADIIKSTSSPTDIQLAQAGNSQTNIVLNELKLTRFKNVTTASTTQVAENLNQARVRFGDLNQHVDIGALLNGSSIRGVVGVRANVPNPDVPGRPPTTRQVTTTVYDTTATAISNPYTTISSSRYFGTLRTAIGDPELSNRWRTGFIWIFTQSGSNVRRYTLTKSSSSSTGFIFSNEYTNFTGISGTVTGVVGRDESLTPYLWITAGSRAYAYNWFFSDNRVKTFNPARTINLGSGTWRGGVLTGSTIWFVNDTSNQAVEFRVSNGSRTGRTISLGSGSWNGGFITTGTYIWFMDGNKARGWVLSSRTRQAGLDFSFPAGTYRGVAGYSDGRVVLYTSTNRSLVYRVTGSRRTETTTETIPGTPDMPGVNVPVTYGAISSNRITETNIDLAGVWTTGQKERSSGSLYLLFRGRNTDYASGSAMHTVLENLLESVTFSVGSATFKLNFAGFVSRRTYSSGSFVYVRYAMAGFSGNANLRDNIIFASSVKTSSDLGIQFRKKAQTGSVEAEEIVEPSVFSATVSTFDDNGNPKEIANEALNNNLILFDVADRNKNMSVFFANETFVKTGGPVQANNYYYQATVDNPLIVNSEVLDFEEPPEALIVRYPLVAVNPVVSAESLLSAEVYNYKCLYKWLDDNGIEHRSQYSDIIQLVTNTPMGEPGNRPTLEVKNINLTNKPEGSIGIEIYRTKNKSETFQLVKEIQNNRNANLTIITDDVLDSQLGQIAPNDKAVVSGAKYVIPFKGRFVFYGFPEKPNRIVITGPRKPFRNDAIGFDRAGLPGDLIEILMEQEVKNVQSMDDFLFISCINGAYIWQLAEGSVRQQEPSIVTGLSNLIADDFKASVETTEGVLFNASENKGIQLLTRGLSWRFEGEPVKDITQDKKVLDIVKKENTEDIVFILRHKDGNTQPDILIYNQRYKIWTTFSNPTNPLVSAVNWPDEDGSSRITGLTEGGNIWQEKKEDRGIGQTFTVETGWFNLSNAFLNYQRLRETSLLAEFEALEGLKFTFSYDYTNENDEIIEHDVTPRTVMVGGQPITTADKKIFRVQQKNQACSSVRIKIEAIAKSAKFDALRFGVQADKMITGQSYTQSGGPSGAGNQGGPGS